MTDMVLGVCELAKASALLVSLFHRVLIARQRVAACNNEVACSTTCWFVLLIKRMYHVN